MSDEHEGLEIVEFSDVDELRSWLSTAATGHPGVWVRLRRAASSIPSITFRDLLVEGIAHGWSESTRRGCDDDFYLQKFTPRRSRGTASQRNLRIAQDLDSQGRLTDAGRRALGL